MDYEAEAGQLRAGYWTPPQGETVIKAAGEISDRIEVIFESDSGQEEIQEKVDLDIVVGNETHVWRIGTSKSARSLFGQLVQLAADMKGLAGKELKVTRVGSGRGTQYTVQPA